MIDNTAYFPFQILEAQITPVEYNQTYNEEYYTDSAKEELWFVEGEQLEWDDNLPYG